MEATVPDTLTPPPRALSAALAVQGQRIALHRLPDPDDATLDLIAIANSLAGERADVAIRMLAEAALFIAVTAGIPLGSVRDALAQAMAEVAA